MLLANPVDKKNGFEIKKMLPKKDAAVAVKSHPH